MMRQELKTISSRALAAALGLAMLAGACSGVGGPTSSASPAAQTASPPAQTPFASPANAPSPSSPGGPPSSGSASSPAASAGPQAPSPSAGASAGTTLPPTGGITEDQAIAAVQAFAPHATGLHVTESDADPAGPSFRVQSADIVAEVDEASGQVRSFLDNAAMPTTTVVKVTRDEALAAATAWLAAHGVSASGLSPVATLIDHGSIQEYAVDYQGRVNGARVPHRVTVSIDPATGAVYAFVLFTRPFVAPPSPRLTPADATAAARAEEKDSGARVTSSDLAIAFDAAGTQILVYELDLTRTDGFYVKVQVDALTGAVTVMGRG